jgi:hypothetical protein
VLANETSEMVARVSGAVSGIGQREIDLCFVVEHVRDIG